MYVGVWASVEAGGWLCLQYGIGGWVCMKERKFEKKAEEAGRQECMTGSLSLDFGIYHIAGRLR